ncbi:MAG TPA: UdgX family uracil-DNA binding protein [Caulobacteraceae bacterium]|jgi:DNA polymerase
MHIVELASERDFAGWRSAARSLRAAGVAPADVAWSVGGGALTFGPPAPTSAACADVFTVPPRFVEMARDAILHRSPTRFDLLYRLLWRLRDEPRLISDETDPDLARAAAMARAVSRAAHKMTAFVRFRLVESDPETFAAWFEPPHHVVERTAPFFRDRFANQRFSILTPDLCCHWDGTELRFTPGAERPHLAEDELEAVWRAYYASIFNPARLNPDAMQSHMPKLYWRNLPEAALIPGLVREAQARTDAMVAGEPTRPQRRISPRPAPSPQAPPEGVRISELAELRPTIQGCRRCGLWRDTTQGVAGEGPVTAPLMLVGEQPGDMEDLEGRPFVGPAGQLLSRALEAAGIVRRDAYVTNAVKHFKHELRGKRRLHKTPDAGEVQACRWWLEQERALVKPKLIVALGGTAALAVFGRAMPIMKSRGKPLALDDGGQGLITVHPSYLLRVPDEEAKATAWRGFVADLTVAHELISTA